MHWLCASGLLWVVACQHQAPRSPETQSPASCPEQTLSAAEAAELSHQGVVKVAENRMGEHHSTASLEAGMPMLKKAALHGDLTAMAQYASLVTWYGFIDNDGDPFLGRSQWENGQEGLLFTLLAAHRGEPIWQDDQETFRVLLDPAVPFPAGFFDDPSGTAWLIQGWPPESVDEIRKKAYQWRDCWAD